MFSHQRTSHVPDAPLIIVQSQELQSSRGWQHGAGKHHTRQPVKSECLQVKGMSHSWWLLEEAQFLALLSQECPLLVPLSDPQSRSHQANRARDQGGELLSRWVLHGGGVCPDIRISSSGARGGLARWTPSIIVVQLLSRVWLFATLWTAAHQPSLSFIISQSLFKFMPTELVIPSNHLILCHPLLLLPSIFPSIKVFSNESALLIRWPKYWSFSFSISPSNEYSGLIFFRMDLFDLLEVQRTLREFSPAPQFKSISSSAVSLPYGLTLTSIHDYWKNHSCEYTDLCRQMFTHKFHWKGVEIHFPFPVNPTSPEGKYD